MKLLGGIEEAGDTDGRGGSICVGYDGVGNEMRDKS